MWHKKYPMFVVKLDVFRVGQFVNNVAVDQKQVCLQKVKI